MPETFKLFFNQSSLPAQFHVVINMKYLLGYKYTNFNIKLNCDHKVF